METALKWLLWAVTFLLYAFWGFFLVLQGAPLHWLLTGTVPDYGGLGLGFIVLFRPLIAAIPFFLFCGIAYQIGVHNGRKGAEPMLGGSRK